MFKKVTFIAALLVIAFGFSSCSSDSATDTPDGELAAAKLAIKSKLAGSMVLAETPVVKPVVEKVPYHWTDAVDILNTFPEKVTPEGVYHNFVFYSNGKPFDLVMLNSNGGFRHKLYIYWYDEDGDCHEEEIWNELEEKESGSQQTWYNANGGKATQISRVSDNAGAYKIQLPKGTKFGFCQESYEYKNGEWVVRTEAVRVEKFGEIKPYPYKFYTEYEKNWNNPLIKDWVPSGQAMTTDLNGWTIIGFEDFSLTNPSCDKDYNDVVFAINPIQKTDPDPERVDGSVETNLSVTEENGTDKVKLSVHVRAVTDFEVIIPVTDQLLADDFAIVAKHDVEWVYKEPIVIADKTVTLEYSMTPEGYLKITSKGITKEVIDYCQNTYADGLTFESYLFYGKFDLKAQPTITFTKYPYLYATSCVVDDKEATDIEVVWEEAATEPIVVEQRTVGKYTYDLTSYSTFTLEELKEMGYFKHLKEVNDDTTPTE